MHAGPYTAVLKFDRFAGHEGRPTAAGEGLENAQRARYEVAHAGRQYDAVDPANRLVAGELERRWNETFQAVAKIEGDIAAMVAQRPPPLW